VCVRQYTCISKYIATISCTQSSRLNKRIALWAFSKATSCQNYFFHFLKIVNDFKINVQLELSNPISQQFVNSVYTAALESHKSKWLDSINSAIGPSGRNNKLRTYCKLKSEFQTEKYCQMIMPLKHRSALAKFRCGVAPLRIETGRYENIPLVDRKCPFCENVETEQHVMLNCELYDDIRRPLFEKAADIDSKFPGLSEEGKFIFLFSNHFMIRLCAKTCFNILQRRTFYLCK
jgi:hypothetical protein